MIGISKIEAQFIKNCLQNNQYFLTNEIFFDQFPKLSKEARYQMLYRLRKKKILYSIMNGHYLISPVEDWFKGKLSKNMFMKGIFAYLNTIDAVITGSTSLDFLKYKKMPSKAWMVTTPVPVTRTKTLKTSSFKQKINISYNKKVFDNITCYDTINFVDNGVLKVVPMTGGTIPPEAFGVEKNNLY